MQNPAFLINNGVACPPVIWPFTIRLDFRRVPAAMTKSALLAVLLVFGLGACGGSRPLAPVGSPGTAGSSTGAAGAMATTGAGGSTAATGVGGAMAFTGAAGSMVFMGAAGDTMNPMVPTPLPVSGDVALQRAAGVLWQQDASPETVAAVAGLKTKEQLAPFVQQLVVDARASKGLEAFFRWWLELDQIATVEKDPAMFPEVTPALRADMIEETIDFGIDATVNVPNGTYHTLLQADWSFLDSRLAALYGVDVTGADLQKTQLDGTQRAGLLTQPSLQMLGSFAARTSPSHRGSEVLRRFFCEAVPPPPPSAATLFSPPPGETTRQALASSVNQPTCNACHAVLDPPGLAFEGFDPIGRTRTLDNGAPVDTSNLRLILPDGNGGTGVVNGAVDLALTVSNDVAAQDCYAQTWLSFALGRDLTPADQASIDQIDDAFQASGLNLQRLIVSVLLSDAFLTSP
jgi:hypothetical protein